MFACHLEEGKIIWRLRNKRKQQKCEERKASALKELEAKKKKVEEEAQEAKRSIEEEIAQLRKL